jgi:hypothetical protein
MSNVIASEPRSGKASSNPLANWANDDLLLTAEARKRVAEAFPRAFPVLDWPALREAFEEQEALANQAKKEFNRHGVRGVFLGTIGASLLALASLFASGPVQSTIVVVGCCFVSLGGLMGFWHLVGHSGRSRWLLARLWTERLRQFYFQYLINNLDAAISAMGDDNKLQTYLSTRDGALRGFIEDTKKNISARSFAEAIRWLADDHEDIRAWGQAVWQANRVLPSTVMTDDHRDLLECLSQGRIGIQEIYAQSNLKPRSASQGNMARQIMARGNFATFVFVASLTLAGIWTLLGSKQGSLPSDVLISLSGVAAAWGLYFRLVDQGMGYSLDAESFELYFEQIGLVRQRFNATADDVYNKIVALRQLEIYSYRELRQFLRTHLQSRFLG